MNRSASARNSAGSASSWASDSARPWVTWTFRPRRARTSLFSWLPGTQNASPAPTMPMTSRSTPGVSGPRSTRSPTKIARRSGWLAPAARPSSSRLIDVAEVAQQGLQLGGAAVDVADDVERPGLVAQVVEEPGAGDRRGGDLLLAVQDVDGPEAFLLQAAQRPPQVGVLAADHVVAEVAVRAARVPRRGRRSPARRARSRSAARRARAPARPASGARRPARWSRPRRSAAPPPAACRR